MIPRTCDGETNEFNLFPYRVKSHNSYNVLFLNMTIWQVWEILPYVHRCLFEDNKERINRDWLRVCKISKSQLEVEIHKNFSVEYLQDRWIKAFGKDSLEGARKTLKYMMLFMVFGCYVAEADYLFDNGNLREFFEEYPTNEDRLKAFNICFGESADWQTIKAKMSKILR